MDQNNDLQLSSSDQPSSQHPTISLVICLSCCCRTINKASFLRKESPHFMYVPDLSGPRVSLFFIQALANALAAAPSMWTLGNAGMGALQRVAEDKNRAIANAASKTIHELKKQWEIQEGDSWRFMMNQKPVEEVDSQEDNNDADTG